MANGIVAWFSNGKGYGFIERPPGEGKDIFVYHSDIVMDGYKTLSQGDRVEFDTAERKGKTVATNVRVVRKVENGSRSNTHKSQFASSRG